MTTTTRRTMDWHLYDIRTGYPTLRSRHYTLEAAERAMERRVRGLQGGALVHLMWEIVWDGDGPDPRA